MILVSYHVDGSQPYIRVDTYQPRNPGPFDGWRHLLTIPATLANGDQLGARALADGTVRVYKNCELIGVVDTRPANSTFFVDKGGRIGVWYSGAPNARFDNFGGNAGP